MSGSTTAEATADDGTPLRVRHWQSVGPPWAAIVLVHGLAEHSGRYEHVGSWLAEAGLEVSAADLRGFGGSGGRRAWVERWSILHDDLEERLASIRAGTPGLPVVLYGHSLGGLVALGYAVALPARPLPDALVLSAPALDATVPGWKRRMARLLNALAPTLTVPNGFDGALLSRDGEVGRRYVADPLNHHSTTVRLGAETLIEQARVRAALARLSIPTLVYQGGADRLVPASALEPLAGLPSVTMRAYPGLRHESHNEPEGREVIADVVAWLRAAVRSPGGSPGG